MNPAPSVIVFSTLSGPGFALLMFLGVDPDPPRGWVAFAFFALAYALCLGGLLSAFLHLKNKRNAWRAYSQWRTSWLSREAWAAALSLALMGLYAALLIFADAHVAPLGWLGGALAIATVLTTAMIYAQLRAVPRWNQAATPAMFLAHALAGGALLWGRETWAGWLFLLAGAITAFHWWRGDRRLAEAGTTLNTATRLPGRVSLLERPHHGESYLTREMVFRMARRHAAKLRVISLLAASLIPAALTLAPLDLGIGAKHALAGAALLIHLAGVLGTRWLFFAEAEHVVGLYYGAHAERTAA